MVSYLLMTELEGARQRRLLTVGFLLLLVNLSTVVLAIWLQLSETNRQAILAILLLEREIREAELIHDAQSLRADVERPGVERSVVHLVVLARLARVQMLEAELHLGRPQPWVLLEDLVLE